MCFNFKKTHLSCEKKLQNLPFTNTVSSNFVLSKTAIKDKLTVCNPYSITAVFFSEPLLFYCVPKELKNLSFETKNALIAFLNKKDVFHKTLSDLVNSWQQMVLLTLISIGTKHLQFMYWC